MKKQVYRVIATIGIFFGLAVVGVQAQTPSKVEVNIPFEFSAGKTTLKPGIYSIRRMSGNLLTLRNVNDKATVILNAPLTITSRDEKAGERLVFNKYGDQYFLTQIWLSVDTGRQVTTPESRTKGTRLERVELSLRTKE